MAVISCACESGTPKWCARWPRCKRRLVLIRTASLANPSARSCCVSTAAFTRTSWRPISNYTSRCADTSMAMGLQGQTGRARIGVDRPATQVCSITIDPLEEAVALDGPAPPGCLDRFLAVSSPFLRLVSGAATLHLLALQAAVQVLQRHGSAIISRCIPADMPLPMGGVFCFRLYAYSRCVVGGLMSCHTHQEPRPAHQATPWARGTVAQVAGQLAAECFYSAHLFCC